jgi:hypothetical protein
VGTPCGGVATAPGQYLLFPLYVNQMINRESAGPVRADPNGVFIQGAEVELRDAAGNALFPAFSVTASDFIPSAVDETESRDVGVLEIVPGSSWVQLSSMVGPGGSMTIIAAVVAFGETNGDVSVETDEFLWPIDVCNGCLYQEVSVDDEGGAVLGCTPGQDGVSIVTCGPAPVTP